MDRLPDELLLEILQLAFPSGSILDDGGKADVLLLFQRWLRISIPLLYRTVILRSKKQAQDLARTLAETPQYARHIERLRLNAGCGVDASTILTAVPHLKHLCLSLDLMPGDDISHLCSSLHLISPTRVSLCRKRWILQKNVDVDLNAHVQNVLTVVGECINLSWTNMVCHMISILHNSGY